MLDMCVHLHAWYVGTQIEVMIESLLMKWNKHKQQIKIESFKTE